MFALTAANLAGCQPGGADASRARGAPPRPAVGPGLYRAPPVAVAVRTVAGGALRLEGRAEAGARVRLAAPSGQATFATAGTDGAWRMDIAPAAAPRLFGLATVETGRMIQSEGYLAVTPDGTAAQLRSGAGALVLGDRRGRLAIAAVDFDSKGGAVVSGWATPLTDVEVLVDGVRRAHGQAGADGDFSVPLDEPLDFSRHRFEIRQAGRSDAIAVDLRAPGRPLVGPYRTEPYRDGTRARGWRIDWLTPGGGVQTTLLMTDQGGPGD